jgi:hypothetical protein
MKIIIAGNYHQARNYAYEHNLPKEDWIFADREEKVRGLSNIEVVKTGEHWLNPLDKMDWLWK